MSRLLLKVALLVAFLVGMAFGTNTFATCPYDGEQATWTGQRNGSACQYAHEHYDSSAGKTVHHQFWADCGN